MSEKRITWFPKNWKVWSLVSICGGLMVAVEGLVDIVYNDSFQIGILEGVFSGIIFGMNARMWIQDYLELPTP